MVEKIVERIKKVLEESVKPELEKDGGDIEFVEFKDGVLKVKFLGACALCPFAQITLQNFVEEELKKEVKDIKRVELV